MNIEELTKHQLILLTLLVSFVTSIATGIVTVTLLDQGPQQITQTINRVVERTVEQVVPGGIQTVIKEVPLYVTEEEQIVKAIDGASPAVVQVTEGSGTPQNFVSGFVLGSKGLVVSVIPSTGEGLTTRVNNYRVMLDKEVVFPATIIKKSGTGNVVVLQIKPERQEEFVKLITARKPLEFSSKDATVGQTVIGIAGNSNNDQAVAVGIISSVTATSTTATLPLIKSTAATMENIGGPLVDTKGQAVGVVISAGTALGKASLKAIIDSIN